MTRIIQQLPIAQFKVSKHCHGPGIDRPNSPNHDEPVDPGKIPLRRVASLCFCTGSQRGQSGDADRAICYAITSSRLLSSSLPKTGNWQSIAGNCRIGLTIITIDRRIKQAAEHEGGRLAPVQSACPGQPGQLGPPTEAAAVNRQLINPRPWIYAKC